MIIAVTAQEGRIDSPVDPRFGRAAYFMIANTETMEVYGHDNSAGVGASNGAGTGAAQLLAEEKVNVLYTGKVGPKAAEALEKAGHVIELNLCSCPDQPDRQRQPAQPGTDRGHRPGISLV